MKEVVLRTELQPTLTISSTLRLSSPLDPPPNKKLKHSKFRAISIVPDDFPTQATARRKTRKALSMQSLESFTHESRLSRKRHLRTVTVDTHTFRSRLSRTKLSFDANAYQDLPDSSSSEHDYLDPTRTKFPDFGKELHTPKDAGQQPQPTIHRLFSRKTEILHKKCESDLVSDFTEPFERRDSDPEEEKQSEVCLKNLRGSTSAIQEKLSITRQQSQQFSRGQESEKSTESGSPILDAVE